MREQRQERSPSGREGEGCLRPPWPRCCGSGSGLGGQERCGIEANGGSRQESSDMRDRAGKRAGSAGGRSPWSRGCRPLTVPGLAPPAPSSSPGPGCRQPRPNCLNPQSTNQSSPGAAGPLRGPQRGRVAGGRRASRPSTSACSAATAPELRAAQPTGPRAASKGPFMFFIQQ